MRLRFTFCSSALWFVLSTLMDIQEWDFSCVLFARQLLGVTLGKWALCILCISYCSHTGLPSPPGTHRGALAVHSAGTLFSHGLPSPLFKSLFKHCLLIDACCNQIATVPPFPCTQIPLCSIPFFPHGTDTLCYDTVCSFMMFVLYLVFLSTVLWIIPEQKPMLVLFMVPPMVLEQQVLIIIF